MTNYLNQISRSQFEMIRPELETARKRTAPRTQDLYQVFNALLYLLKTGCQWRQLPHDFPKWSTVYYYYRIWSAKGLGFQESLLEQVLKKIVFTLRSQQDRSALTSFIIVDAQSVKNTDTAQNKGYDGGKKISGIKRHLAVDINGLPQAIHITRANVSDRDGAGAMLALHADHLKNVRSVLVDGGYTGTNFAIDVKTNLKATVQVAKRNELHNFTVMPQRWIIERSFSWLDKCRRLWKNCERHLNTSLQMVVLAFLALLLKRL